ncbi:MAG: tetratricopeptide repeat protein, partial [Planctomycetes bacterium]|nr:tetratricopeptide repeat protein [Planctomycetota bacterium]
MVTLLNRILAFCILAGALLAGDASLRAGEADDLFAVAAAHYDRGRWKLAVEEFQTFLRKYPHDQRRNRCVFFLGEALLQLGKYDDARARFQEYVGREPSGQYAQAAMFRIGEAAYLAGNYDAAKADLDRF